ncbi:MAG: hypothetical protein ABSB19_07800 [Methylomonas sp.]|jgi:hypothetical protein
MQVLPVAGGWGKVLDKFRRDHAAKMQNNQLRHMLLLLDFDDEVDNRRKRINNEITEQIANRVFVLGVKSEPEKLKIDSGKTFEQIGATLAKECIDNSKALWSHPLLTHNQAELDRLITIVKPFLFRKPSTTD